MSTQAEMVALVRDAIEDRDSTRLTADTAIYRGLNFNMREVSRLIMRHQAVQNFCNAAATITTDGTNTQFAVSDSGFVIDFKATRTDSTHPEPCRRIDEREEARYTYGDGFDEQGRLVYWITWNTSGAALVEFPVIHAAGIVMRLEYCVRPARLATDGSASASTFTLVNEDFQDLIVMQTARDLIGADRPNFAYIAGRCQELRQDLISTLRQRSVPQEVASEFPPERPW